MSQAIVPTEAAIEPPEAPTDLPPVPLESLTPYDQWLQGYYQRVAKDKAILAAQQEAARQAEIEAALRRLREGGISTATDSTPTLSIKPMKPWPAPTQPQPQDAWEFEPRTLHIVPPPPRPKEYQFDLGNALLTASALALVAFIWFARRRIKWLATKCYAVSGQIIRWLHMPPDGKI